jgi:Rieske Fe-S protein
MAAAMIIKDLINKGDNPWAPIYNPSRFSHVKEFLMQNLDVAKNYISGKLEQVPDSTDVRKGEARVISVDGKKTGAYRDEDDNLHLLDITCTHVGCELEWNSAERSWDCPCHGSRFGYQGNIIEGPALNCLNQIDEGRNKVEPNVYQ